MSIGPVELLILFVLFVLVIGAVIGAIVVLITVVSGNRKKQHPQFHQQQFPPL